MEKETLRREVADITIKAINKTEGLAAMFFMAAESGENATELDMPGLRGIGQILREISNELCEVDDKFDNF